MLPLWGTELKVIVLLAGLAYQAITAGVQFGVNM